MEPVHAVLPCVYYGMATPHFLTLILMSVMHWSGLQWVSSCGGKYAPAEGKICMNVLK